MPPKRAAAPWRPETQCLSGRFFALYVSNATEPKYSRHRRARTMSAIPNSAAHMPAAAANLRRRPALQNWCRRHRTWPRPGANWL